MFFLRQDIDRSGEGLNLWSLRTDPGKGEIVRGPQQLSRLKGAVLSQLTGSRDSKTITVVRTERPIQTYVGEWRTTPDPALENPRRLTLEEVDTFPHGWTPDNQSVILESDRNGRLEIFRQKLTRREAELLISTPGDVYMPQVTPDGKRLLMMSRVSPSPGKPDDPSQHRLLRAPIDGGQTVEVHGEPLDEFRCSLPGRGTVCVLRATHGNEQRYFDLDPVAGKGRRWEHSEEIKEFGRIGGISPLPSGDGWLATSPTNSFQILEAPSRTANLYYVDKRLNAHRLYKSYVSTYGVFSPDEKHVAFVGTALTSNIWAFQR